MKAFRNFVIIFFVLALFAGCGNTTKPDSNPTVPTENTKQQEATEETNLDGTPVQIKPALNSDGTTVTNKDGKPVYEIIGKKDKDGKPVLVVIDNSSGKPVYKIQERTEKDGKEVIQDATSAPNVPITTSFASTTASTTVPPAGQVTEPEKTSSPGDGSLPDSIDLGGVFGTVKKYKDNVYRGTFDDKKMEKLRQPVTYANMGATFTRGVYVPEKIGPYTVVQVAYTRFYEFKDEYTGEYDWYTQRASFKPSQTDPIVYIESNDTFKLDKSQVDVHQIFLIELMK